MTDSFTLRSEITDLVRMRIWLNDLIHAKSINRNTAFSISLALDEALANIILHGYNSEPGHIITIHFQQTSQYRYLFIIEDTAPHFSPLTTEHASPSTPCPLTPGGLGLTLLRKFTTSLAYESLSSGNRLILTFDEY